jgi:phenylalanyl-tRNA synthetase beta chain
VEIINAELNPRFVLGLIKSVEIRPSPYWVQRRLRLSGIRPINNIVDATNYVMWEVGEPLHAFDYDVLVSRAGGKPPKIITRTAQPSERLTTLDGVERVLDSQTELVCDTAGALSIAGVMGGAESEVSDLTRNVLLEGAAWNFINIRRTMSIQKLLSEASYRFSRGVHPAMAPRGVGRGLELMRQWSGGVVYKGLVDSYPLPPTDPTVEITAADVERWLGIQISLEEIAGILRRLEFVVEILGTAVHATAPDHRLDIGTGVTGKADLLEEIARIYGYERIPETRLADALPPQAGNPAMEREDLVRDTLVNLGLQEVITNRLTSEARESRRHPPGLQAESAPYVRLINPIASDRYALRQSLLSSVLEVVEHNNRLRPRQALFEIGPVFYPKAGDELPEEPAQLAIVLTGPRALPDWHGVDSAMMDFYDLKGLLSMLFKALHLDEIRYQPAEHPSYHPGKCAKVFAAEIELAVFGELHPLVHERYEFPPTPVLAAEINLLALLEAIPTNYAVEAVPDYPPILEDLAIIVDEYVTAEQVELVVRKAAGKTLSDLRLFDVYRGSQIGEGKKSLAYSLIYQDPERTLQDKDAQKIRQKIVQALGNTLNAHLRS